MRWRAPDQVPPSRLRSRLGRLCPGAPRMRRCGVESALAALPSFPWRGGSKSSLGLGTAQLIAERIQGPDQLPERDRLFDPDNIIHIAGESALMATQKQGWHATAPE